MNIVNATLRAVNLLVDDERGIREFLPLISIQVSKNDNFDMEKEKCKT